MPVSVLVLLALHAAEPEAAPAEGPDAGMAAVPSPPRADDPVADFVDSLKLGVLAEVGASAGTGQVPSFGLGDIDLFASSRVGRHVSLLAEIAFEPTDAQGVRVDIERVELTYVLDDRLRVSAGRMRQALGHYNTAHQHAAYFLTTCERPLAVAFADEGGLLPVHLVGVQATGTFDFEVAAVSYSLGVGNGRGTELEQVQQTFDVNKQKSVAGGLWVALPDFGLTVGGNLLWDRIPELAASDAFAAVPSQTELIAGAWLLYEVWKLRASVEGYWIRHGDGAAAPTALSGFIELALGLGTFTPYARLDATHFAGGPSPLFLRGGHTGDQGELVLGLRADLVRNVALKAEWAHQRFQTAGDADLARLQAAVSF